MSYDGEVNIDAIEGAEGTLMAGERPDHEGDVFRAFAEHRAKGLSDEACTGPRRPNAYCDIDGDSMTLGMFGANGIDSVIALARALDVLSPEDRQNPDRIYEAIKTVCPFDGTSGRVVLNDINERVGVMTITNLQLIIKSQSERRLAVVLSSTIADFVPVGVIDENGVFLPGGIEHTDGKIYDVQFPGSTSEPPSDRDDEGSGSSNKGTRDVAWWVWLAIFGTIGGVLICIACGLATLRVRGELKRKRKLEKTNTFDPAWKSTS